MTWAWAKLTVHGFRVEPHPSHNYSNGAYRCWKCQVKQDHPKALTQCVKVEIMNHVKYAEEELLKWLDIHINNATHDWNKSGNLFDHGWASAMQLVKKELTDGHQVITETPQ